jgi:hypothetical protein
MSNTEDIYVLWDITPCKLIRKEFFVLGWGSTLQAGRSRVRFPMRSLYISIQTAPPLVKTDQFSQNLWRKWHWSAFSPTTSASPAHFGSSCILCGLVVRVNGYRFRGTGFDSRRYQIFWGAVGLERRPPSFVRITDELLERKSSGPGSRKQRLTAVESIALTTRHPLSARSWH